MKKILMLIAVLVSLVSCKKEDESTANTLEINESLSLDVFALEILNNTDLEVK